MYDVLIKEFCAVIDICDVVLGERCHWLHIGGGEEWPAMSAGTNRLWPSL